MFTVDEAAAKLGCRWRAVKFHMIKANWLVLVGPGTVRCSAGALSAGYLHQITEQRPIGVTGTMEVEVGFRITARGMTELSRITRR